MDYHLTERRLPGAAAGVILWMVLLLSVACDTSRSARTAGSDQGNDSQNERPETGSVDSLEASSDVAPDTLIRVGETSAEMDRDERFPEKELRDQYEVLLLLPFLTNRYDNIQRKFNRISRWSLNFYGGVQMALDELRETELGLRLTVLDSEGSEEKVRYLLGNRSRQDSTHLVIGPYRRVNIQQAAAFGKKESVNVVSPYSAASNLTEKNPHFIQVRPSLKTHCTSLVHHALENYPADKIILVGQDRSLERQSFEYFQEAYFEKVGTRDTNRLELLLIGDSNESISNMQLDSFMVGRDTAVFLVSAWRGEDESFVYSFLRQLEVSRHPELNEEEEEEQIAAILAEKQNQEIVVYGTPVWKDFDRVDLDYFEKLKVHISSHIFLDASDTGISKFRRAYYNRFGNLPQEEAFLGYDVMRYFGKMLLKHGTQFQYFLEREAMEGLHTRFEFERVVKPSTTGAEEAPIEQFENKYVHILRFQDYQFKLVE